MKSLLRLLPYLARYKRTLLLGLLTVVLSNVFAVVQPLLVGKAVDALKTGIEQHSIDTLRIAGYAGLVVILSLIAGTFTFLTRQTIIVVSRKVEFDLRNDFLAHTQRLPLSFFQNTPTGDLMARATNDVGAVRNVLGPGIMYPTDTLMTLMMVLVVMFSLNWQLTLIALIPLPFVSYAVYALGQVVHRKFEERQQQYGELTTRAQENLSGIRVIKAYVREAFETSIFRNESWEYLKKNLVLARVQSIMWPLMFLLVGGSIVLTLYFGGVRVINGEFSIGSLTAFFGYLTMLIWPMIAFGWVVNILQQGAASMGRITMILDTVPAIRDAEETVTPAGGIKGHIEFKQVSFTYEGADRPALEEINLDIPAGTTLAVIGYTGSGKSTLVSLIPRLQDVTTGELLIDGIDVRCIPLQELRAHIGYVPQETFLFSDSIEDNIAYGVEQASEGQVREAAEVAQISRDVAEFPHGFRTVVGERGITLSGGQKQRTSIARALVRQPEILILDDALSAVDTYTEEEILKRLRGVMRGRTSILISHRISTVKDADMIIVLHEGRIVERGNHDQLVALGGIYAELHRKQLLEEELEHIE